MLDIKFLIKRKLDSPEIKTIVIINIIIIKKIKKIDL